MEQPAPRRYEALDAYRGIAALAIVAYHSYSRSGRPYAGTPLDDLILALWLGVGIFFALSAFVITLPFVRAVLADQAGPSVRGFAVRRALRILPLYYLVLLVAWLYETGHVGSLHPDRRVVGPLIDLGAHVTLTQIYRPWTYYGALPPAWSLAVEALFYALVAAWALLVARRAPGMGRRSRLLAVSGPAVLLIVASVAYKLLAPVHDGADWVTYTWPLVHLDAFGLGWVLAVVVALLPTGHRPARPIVLAGTLAGTGLLVGHFLLALTPIRPQRFAFLPGAGGFTLVMAATVLGAPGRWARLLASRPLAALGALSYGVYLWHFPLLRVAGATGLLYRSPADFVRDTAILIVATLALSAATYRLVERPAIALGRRWSRALPPAPRAAALRTRRSY